MFFPTIAVMLLCTLLSAAWAGDTSDGYEYVIIAPDEPAFLAWADSLRSLRTMQGISTGVFDTAELGYTWQAIRDFLANAYWSWITPPEAVLLLGDVPESGDQPGVPAPIWENSFVSDNLYADVDGDGLPDFAIARMTSRNEIELSHMVGKVLAHDRCPSLDPDFYDRPVFASGWAPYGNSVMQTETYLGFLNGSPAWPLGASTLPPPPAASGRIPIGWPPSVRPASATCPRPRSI